MENMLRIRDFFYVLFFFWGEGDLNLFDLLRIQYSTLCRDCTVNYQMQSYVKYQTVVIFLMSKGQTQLLNWLWILFKNISIKRLNVFPNIEVHFPSVLKRCQAGSPHSLYGKVKFCKCKNYTICIPFCLKVTSHLLYYLLGQEIDIYLFIYLKAET